MDIVPEKECTICHKILPATTDFFNKKDRGLYGLCSWCKKCHSNRCKKAAREWVLRNPEKQSQHTYNWRHSKHGKKLLNRAWHTRRARELTAEGTHANEDIELQYKSQKGKCWWCGKPVGDNYHVDHRIALTKGGTNWPNNLCISCPSCNTSKGNKLPHEWIGRLI